MKKVIFLIPVLILIGCKPSPSYNPFDSQFDISVNNLIKDGCDSIYAGGGYINLQVTYGNLRPYYQVHADKFNNVVAKGFTYYVDTNSLAGMNDIYNEYTLDSILSSFIDFEKFNLELRKFNYVFLEHNGEEVKIFKEEMSDTLILSLWIYHNGNDSIAIREISYWKEKY